MWNAGLDEAQDGIKIAKRIINIKRCLLLGRKAITNLDSIWKSRDITLLIKVCLVKAMVFPVVTYGCENWTIKESWVPKNWCFWTVVLEKTLSRVPWTTRRSNQLIRKEISPEYSLEGLMLKLKLQYCGPLTQRTDSLEKTLMQEEKGTTEDEMVGWHHRLNADEFEQTLGDSEGQGSLAC